MAKAKSPTWKPFKTNGYAKSYTPKTTDSNAKTHLKQIKDGTKSDRKNK